jgi:hypothetical protein
MMQKCLREIRKKINLSDVFDFELRDSVTGLDISIPTLFS